MRCGSLPLALRNPELAEETLAAYVGTYLQEEIKEKALVRRVAEFHEVAPLKEFVERLHREVYF